MILSSESLTYFYLKEISACLIASDDCSRLFLKKSMKFLISWLRSDSEYLNPSSHKFAYSSSLAISFCFMLSIVRTSPISLLCSMSLNQFSRFVLFKDSVYSSFSSSISSKTSICYIDLSLPHHEGLFFSHMCNFLFISQSEAFLCLSSSLNVKTFSSSGILKGFASKLISKAGNLYF